MNSTVEWRTKSTAHDSTVVLHGFVDGVLRAIVRRDPASGYYTAHAGGRSRRSSKVRSAKLFAETVLLSRAPVFSGRAPLRFTRDELATVDRMLLVMSELVYTTDPATVYHKDELRKLQETFHGSPFELVRIRERIERALRPRETR